MKPTDSHDVEFVGLYVIPGEGPVAALQDRTGTHLFDKEGLQHRIFNRRKSGHGTDAEEQALARINQHQNNGVR